MRTTNLLLALSILLLVGCKTWNPTPKRAAFESIKETSELVQAGLRGYGDYIRIMQGIAVDVNMPESVRKDAQGNAEGARELAGELRDIYGKYQQAAVFAVDTVGLDYTSVPTEDMIKLAIELLTLIESYQ